MGEQKRERSLAHGRRLMIDANWGLHPTPDPPYDDEEEDTRDQS